MSLPTSEVELLSAPNYKKVLNEEEKINAIVSNRGDSRMNLVAARRSGSAANVIQNPDGTISTVRRLSNMDVNIAITRRLSASSQPNIAAVLGLMPPPPPVELMMGAQDTLDRTKGQGDFFEHLWSLDALSDKYLCNINLADVKASAGLTTETAGRLLEEFGPNVLTPPAKVPLWLLFLLQFTNLLMVLLMITGALCLILYGVDPTQLTNLYLGVLLFVVVLVTCYETYSQEAKSDELMEKFRAMVPEKASVIRNGVMLPLSSPEIVPGDLIRLKSGDKVPADCRVISSQSMKVDQAMITGESEPVDVSVSSKNQNPLESKNIIFNGSLVVDGGCLAVAIRTGDGTLIGKMVDLTGDVGKTSSTLQADIVYFVRVLTIFALFQAALVFIVGCARGLDPVQVFIQGFVVIMIGNVPQGLPTTITACLFIVADRMGKHNVFVKKLDIIESLGSCTCICTDKTGTLTQNLMSVANTWYMDSKIDFKSFAAENLALAGAARVPNARSANPQMEALIRVAALNSRVMMESKPSVANPAVNELVPNGDATELGLYRFFGQCITDSTGSAIEEFRAANPKVFEVPFNSKNKWQMSVHAMQTPLLPRNDPEISACTGELLLLKGAPDVLLSKCNRYLAKDGSICVVDEAFRTACNTAYEDFGGNGERVLGFAMRPLDRPLAELEAEDPEYREVLKARLVGTKKGKDPNEAEVIPMLDLIFAGLITLKDPPRDEVPQAIRECYSAGVKVVMVTGDHPLTAEAIARNIGLINLPTRLSLAKARKCAEHDIAKNDPEIGAAVVRGIEISGGTEMVNGAQVVIPPMSEDDWKVLVNRKEIVFARTSPENKLTIVNEFTKAGHVTAMTGDGVNDSPALKQAAIGIAMGLNGSDVAREAGDIVLLDDNFASIVIGIREGRLLFANLKKSIAYTLAHLVPEVVPVLLWAFVGIPQPMGSLLALCVDLLTELLPSSAFAYEKAESLIMKVPPRNVNTDKLTSFPLLNYAYFQSGMILTAGCFFTYFRTFQHYGVTPNDLFTNNNKFFPTSDGSVFHTTDGRHYGPADQRHILAVIQGTWYLMIVCGQAAHIWVCRTGTVALYDHGMFSNMAVNIAVVCALLLGCFVTYTPGLQDIVNSANPYSLEILYSSLWTFAALWIWAEGRKWFTRTYPDSRVNKSLAW